MPRMTKAQKKAARLKTFRAHLQRITLEIEAAYEPLLDGDISEQDWEIIAKEVQGGLEELIENTATEEGP